MFDLIMYFIFFVFGSYLDFVSRIKWIKKLYKFRDCNDIEKEEIKDKSKNLAKQDGTLNLHNMNLTWFYIKFESFMSLPFLCCLNITKTEWLQKMVIDKGFDNLDDDFNYRKIL